MTVPGISDCLQKKARVFGTWAGAVFFLLQFQLLQAQGNVTFEASITAKEVVVGAPFELSFSLKNAEGSRFSPPVFTGFKTGGISEMRGMNILNGRSSTSQTWSVELIATKPGTYTIGPATVWVNGREMSTKPLTIKAISASASTKGNVVVPPGSDDKVFVAAEFDTKEAYVGQQVTWRIRLYTQLSVEGYDIIALPNFEGFFSKEKVRYDKRVEYINLRGGKKYAVRTLHEEALFPQEAGELTVSTARVSVGIEQPGAQGFLFGPKPVSLQTQPIALLVKPLPQPQPAEFTGAVGDYEWEFKGDTTALTTDDALTLIVEVKGNGDTRRFAAPKIAVPTTCEIFEPRILEEEEYEGENEILHRKKFEYVVLPKDTGEQVISPVFVYFNPDSNRYCEIRPAFVRITVTPGKNYQSPNNLPDIQAPTPSVSESPGWMTKVLGWLKSPILWGVLALPFLILGIVVLLKRRKTAPQPSLIANHQSTNHQSPITSQPITPPSLASARQRFAEAGRLLQEGDARRFYDELFRSLQAWLSARLGLQPAQMNDADVSKALLQRGATPIRTQALLSVWHTCEQSIYGGQAQPEQMESTWQMAGQVLEALDRELR
jgi:hypothetical protein